MYTSRPLYGGGSGVCVYFVYVYIFCDLLVYLIVFGAPFVLLGATLGFLLGALGAPWAPNGPSLASFWSPFGSLGTPWGHLGHLGLPSGAWDDLKSKMDVLFRASGPQVARLRIKSDLDEFSDLSAVSAVSTQSGARATAPNPTSLAPGARMT